MNYVQYLEYSVFGETQLSCIISFWNKIWFNENASDSFLYSCVRDFCAYELQGKNELQWMNLKLQL